VIQAIRFALGDPDELLDAVLQPVLVSMIVTMLKDADLENRRLALTTLNSALKHKTALIIRSLHQMLPLVLAASVPDESLIREVQMGPFKHKVDDGLENRKASTSLSLSPPY
jgi:cullin-associated NEDD8-dissociated protein 1